MLRKSNARNSMAPWITAPRLSRVSGVHVAVHPRSRARKITAAFSWISRLEPLEVVFLTDFNCDIGSGKPPISNTVCIRFTQKNRQQVPEPPEHWGNWLELRERLPRRDWPKAERLLRQLAQEVADVMCSGKPLVSAKLRRELEL